MARPIHPLVRALGVETEGVSLILEMAHRLPDYSGLAVGLLGFPIGVAVWWKFIR